MVNVYSADRLKVDQIGTGYMLLQILKKFLRQQSREMK